MFLFFGFQSFTDEFKSTSLCLNSQLSELFSDGQTNDSKMLIELRRGRVPHLVQELLIPCKESNQSPETLVLFINLTYCTCRREKG